MNRETALIDDCEGNTLVQALTTALGSGNTKVRRYTNAFLHAKACIHGSTEKHSSSISLTLGTWETSERGYSFITARCSIAYLVIPLSQCSSLWTFRC